MVDALEEFNVLQPAGEAGEPRFGLRVGINCGHLVAGVVGT